MKIHFSRSEFIEGFLHFYLLFKHQILYWILFYREVVILYQEPPKTEEHLIEVTHHQRTYVKLNRQCTFSETSDIKRLSLDISFDYKAYVRPGTDGKYIYSCFSLIKEFTTQNQSGLNGSNFGRLLPNIHKSVAKVADR